MPRKYVIASVVVLALLVIVGLVRRRETREGDPTLLHSEETVTAPDSASYPKLRSDALSTMQRDLRVSVPAGEPYGVVMDWGMEDGTITVTAFADGSASMYVSTGGGVVGGGNNAAVRDAARQAVETAQNFLSQLKRSSDTALPPRDVLKVYALTTRGRYECEASMSEIERGSTRYLGLFNAVQSVLSELQKVSDGQS